MPSPTRKLRWGILGDAKINRRLIPAIQKAANAELVAIASRSAAKAQAAAAAADIPRSFGSYEELLRDPAIDIVYIPLPNHLHAEWTMKAADAGKSVLCEKPLAANARQAEEMADHCRARGVRLLDGFMWPHHSRTAALRAAIEQGQIGEVRRASAAFSFQLDLESDNVRHHAEMGGGSLLDVGCYPVYFFRWLFQAEPTRVTATAEMRNGVDVRMDALLEFPNGRTALFDCAFNLPYRIGAEIVGTKGRIVIPQMWLPAERATFEIVNGESDLRTIVTLPADDMIVRMVESFSLAVAEKRDPPFAGEGVKTMKVLDALARSARERTPIVL